MVKNREETNLNRKNPPSKMTEVSNVIKDVSNVVKEFPTKHINKKE